jgi:hypothetical protein
MRFSLFPRLVQCIFCIWVPNMASYPGPILYFHNSDVHGVLELLHTHLGFIFPNVFIFLLVIISHYLVSYILGENIPPGEYSLLVDTSV